MTRRVVVLGGGPGGLVAANTLAKSPVPDVEIILVDRSGTHLFLPGLVAIFFGEAEPSAHQRPLADLAHPSVKVVTGEVQAINATSRLVSGSFGEIGYDELVIALGADVAASAGALGEELAPWTLTGAIAGREALSRVGPQTRVVVGAAGLAYRCPPAVFDLAVRIRATTGARVDVVHPWAAPLAPFGRQVSAEFTSMLAGAGIGYHGGFQVSSAGDGRLTGAGGEEVPYDVAFLVPPHRPPAVVAGSELAGDNGWPRVAFPAMTHPSFPEVSIIGDLAAVSLTVGMAGTLAISEARFVAARIAAAAHGVRAPAGPQMSALCFVDTGDTGSALACDFTAPASGNGPAACVLLPAMPYFRRAKRLFAEEWFTGTLR